MRWLLTVAVVMFAVAAFTLSSLPAASARTADPGGNCIAHRPLYIPGAIEVHYQYGCSGHDEPELDPVSNLPGSGKDLTWWVVLPSDGVVPVSAVGPTFWFGGTVTDPNSLFGQAFVELQFYADSVVTTCTPHGGFVIHQQPNVYSACSPVWELTQTGTKGVFHETAAFNAMLTNGTGKGPLLMNAGDKLSVHWFTTTAKDGYHVTVTDWTTGGWGTIVLNSKKDGPLMPAFDRQTVGNALAWGAVNDTANSFVWEIGHTSDFLNPHGEFCTAGNPECASYNRASWAGTHPIEIVAVTFANGANATRWAVVSDLGGKSEVAATCPTYGGPFCIYPWYTLNSQGWSYGVNFPGTTNDFGKANQFAQQPLCGGPFGANSTFCDKIV